MALGFSVRPGGVEVGIALGVITVYVLVFVRMAIPEERTHVVEYGVVVPIRLVVPPPDRVPIGLCS